MFQAWLGKVSVDFHHSARDQYYENKKSRENDVILKQGKKPLPLSITKLYSLLFPLTLVSPHCLAVGALYSQWERFFFSLGLLNRYFYQKICISTSEPFPLEISVLNTSPKHASRLGRMSHRRRSAELQPSIRTQLNIRETPLFGEFISNSILDEPKLQV